MKFTDLNADFPSLVGLYDVLIQDVDKDSRYVKARWTGQDFELIGDVLIDSEFIQAYYFCDFAAAGPQ